MTDIQSTVQPSEMQSTTLILLLMGLRTLLMASSGMTSRKLSVVSMFGDFFIFYFDEKINDWTYDMVSLDSSEVLPLLRIYEYLGCLHAYEVAV